MKKLFLTLLAVMAMAGFVYADATYTSTTNIKGGNADFAVGGVVDQTNGYTQRIDSEGAAYVQQKAQTLAVSTTSLTVGESLVTGAARVSTITYGGPTANAGDYVLIYDALTATGTAKFDISIGTTKSTVTINIPGGAIFATGIFADGAGTAHSSVLTVTYDN